MAHGVVVPLDDLRARGPPRVGAGRRVIERKSRGPRRGEEYLLERRLFRRLSTGRDRDPRSRCFVPARWYYDVLRGLDYFREAERDPTTASTKRSPSSPTGASRTAAGRSRIHQGPTHFEMDERSDPAAGIPCGPCECFDGPASRRDPKLRPAPTDSEEPGPRAAPTTRRSSSRQMDATRGIRPTISDKCSARERWSRDSCQILST